MSLVNTSFILLLLTYEILLCHSNASDMACSVSFPFGEKISIIHHPLNCTAFAPSIADVSRHEQLILRFPCNGIGIQSKRRQGHACKPAAATAALLLRFSRSFATGIQDNQVACSIIMQFHAYNRSAMSSILHVDWRSICHVHNFATASRGLHQCVESIVTVRIFLTGCKVALQPIHHDIVRGIRLIGVKVQNRGSYTKVCEYCINLCRSNPFLCAEDLVSQLKCSLRVKSITPRFFQQNLQSSDGRHSAQHGTATFHLFFQIRHDRLAIAIAAAPFFIPKTRNCLVRLRTA